MEKEKLKKEVMKNSFWNFVYLIMNRFGALIFTVILIRFLMPTGYGIYSIVLSFAMIFYAFADLGINRTMIRYISEAFEKNKKSVYSYHMYLLKIKLILVLIASISLLALSYPLAFFVFKNAEFFIPLVVASAYIFIFAFEGFYTNMFYSIENVKFVSFKEFLNQLMRLCFVLIIIFFVSSSYYIIGVFLALTLSSLILFLFSFYYIRKLSPILFKKSDTKINKKGILKFIFFMSLATISGVFFSYIDSIMLGIFVLPEFVGYYRASFSLVIGIIGLVSFPNLILLSTFTKLKEKNRESGVNFSFKYLSMISIPATLGLFVLGNYFIIILYGPAYALSILSLYILSFLIFFNVSTNLFLSMFTAEKKPEIFAKLILITGIINIILNFVLIKGFLHFSPLWHLNPSVGATVGAAIATLLSWVFYFIASLYYIKKEFNFNISLKKIVKPLIAGIIMIFVLYYEMSIIKDINIWWGIFLVLEGIIVYLGVLLLIKGITKQDLSLIKLLIKK